MKKIMLLLIGLLLIVGMNRVDGAFYFVPKNADTDEISSTYAFSPKFNGAPTVKIGNMHPCGEENSSNVCINANSWYINKGESFGDVSALYQNVGYYDGTAVDLKISLSRIEYKSAESVSIGFPSTDIGISTKSDNNRDANVYFDIQYLKHGTNELIVDNSKLFKSNITFTDLDYNETIGIEKTSVSSRRYVYVLDTKPMIYTITGSSISNLYHISSESDENYFYYSGSHDIALACSQQVDETHLTVGFGDANCGDVEGDMGDPMYGVIKYDSSIMNESSRKNVQDLIKSGSTNYLANDPFNFHDEHEYLGWKLSKKNSDGTTNEEGIRNLNFFSQAGMLTVLFNKPKFTISWKSYYLGFTNSGFLKVGELHPTKFISTVSNPEIHTNDDGTADRVEVGEEVTYQIIQVVPNQPSQFYYDKWYIQDSIPSELNVIGTDIIVESSNPNIDSSDFIIEFDSHTNQLTVRAKNENENEILKNENFYKNNIVTITIKGKVKEGLASGTLFRNQANLYIIRNGEKKGPFQSNIVSAQIANTTCETRLNQIRSNYNGLNKGETVNALISLYQEYPSENLNRLLNYKLNGNILNLDDVECSTAQCESSDVFECETGDITSSQPMNSNIERRVCYANTNDSQGSFTYEDLGLTCNASYSYELPFWNDTVYAGQNLWRTLKGKNLGILNMTVDCFGTVNNGVTAEIDYNKLPSNIKPTFDLVWKTGKNNKEYNMKLSYSNYTRTDNSDQILCDGSGCVVNLSYTYRYPLNYSNNWYSNGINGVLSRGDGYGGLPIAIEDAINGNVESSVDFSFKALNYDYSTTCGYTVENQILKKDYSYNFDFRVIDTSNPFPGINGSENSFRYTGSNWCMSANIGKIRVDDAGHEYRVGDVNGDGIINQSDWQVTSEVFMSSIASDVDGNGTTYNSSNCAESKSDSCILVRYTQSNQNQNCIGNYEKNTIIEKYIENRPNSSSNTPMYSITLTPADISEIRKYNKDHAYNEFNMKCENQNEKCTSNFISDWMDGKIDGLNSNSFNLNAWCMNDRILNKKWCDNMEVTE